MEKILQAKSKFGPGLLSDLPGSQQRELLSLDPPGPGGVVERWWEVRQSKKPSLVLLFEQIVMKYNKDSFTNLLLYSTLLCASGIWTTLI